MESNETVIFTDRCEIAIKSREVPRLEPGQVLVESSRSLISTGTELTLLAGDAPPGSVWDRITNFPVVGPGYCAVGNVIQVGEGVEDDWIGERVALWEPHQRYHTVDVGETFPVPVGVSDEAATFFAIALIVMNGLRTGSLQFGESVAVYGLGLLGQLTVRLAHIAGARPVCGVDIRPGRLGFLPQTANVIGVDPRDVDVSARVGQENEGRLADVVFEVTGNADAIPAEFEALREQGRLVVLSSPDGPTKFDFHDHCNRGSYRILGAHVYGHPDHPTSRDPWTKSRHAELFFRYLLDGDLDVDPLITHRDSYRNASAVYRMLLEDRSDQLGVVFEW